MAVHTKSKYPPSHKSNKARCRSCQEILMLRRTVVDLQHKLEYVKSKHENARLKALVEAQTKFANALDQIVKRRFAVNSFDVSEKRRYIFESTTACCLDNLIVEELSILNDGSSMSTVMTHPNQSPYLIPSDNEMSDCGRVRIHNVSSRLPHATSLITQTTLSSLREHPPPLISMSPNDWIIVGFACVSVVLSLVCRWQRDREQREWAEFHAPLSDDASDLQIDITLKEAKAATLVCKSCGFQNFSSKIFCVMCRESLINVKSSRAVAKNGKEEALHPTRSVPEWIRKVDVEGQLYWFRNTSIDPVSWPSYIVRLSLPDTSDMTLILEDPSKADAAAMFSKRWLETHPARASQFVDAQQQPFPTRVADFAVQVHARRDPEVKPTQFHLHRDTLRSESIDALARLSATQVRSPIRVAFIGEPGVDAGGVYREWCSLLSEQLARPDAGIFTCIDPQSQHFYLNPHSADVLGEHHLAHFVAAGRFVGRALLGGDTLGFHLAPPLLKLLLGEPVGFPDLANFDPEVHRHLQWLVENDNNDSLGLDFTVCEPVPSGETRVVELVDGGRDIAVTDTNKHDYINALTFYRLVHSVSSQLGAFLRGFYDVVPLEALALFDVRELDYVLCGSDDDAIDIDDWERHTRYTQDLWHHPTRQWFWEIVREMPAHYQRRLLQFSTGATRVPLVGFQGLTSYDGRLAPFTLVGRPLADEGFVRSHACFNRLDVPRYVNKNHLKRGLYALLETDVHGFSTV